MRAFLVLLVAVLAAAIVYSVPVALEVQLLRWQMNPWILRVLLVDFPPCAFLLLLGLRWQAIVIGCVTAAAEGLALALGLGPEILLAAVLNLPAAAFAGLAAMRIALRYTVVGEENL
jgi:hypothetical protein